MVNLPQKFDKTNNIMNHRIPFGNPVKFFGAFHNYVDSFLQKYYEASNINYPKQMDHFTFFIALKRYSSLLNKQHFTVDTSFTLFTTRPTTLFSFFIYITKSSYAKIRSPSLYCQKQVDRLSVPAC